MWQLSTYTDYTKDVSTYADAQTPICATAEEEILGIAYRIDPRFPMRDGELVPEWQHLDHPDKHWTQGYPYGALLQNTKGAGTLQRIICGCGVAIGTLFVKD